MFVVIDEITYRENDIVNYDNSYGHIKGVVKYGEWVQNSSCGEYIGSYCYGWYVEFVDLTPFDDEEDTKEEILRYYPKWERNQSLLKLVRSKREIKNFRMLNEANSKEVFLVDFEFGEYGSKSYLIPCLEARKTVIDRNNNITAFTFPLDNITQEEKEKIIRGMIESEYIGFKGKLEGTI